MDTLLIKDGVITQLWMETRIADLKAIEGFREDQLDGWLAESDSRAGARVGMGWANGAPIPPTPSIERLRERASAEIVEAITAQSMSLLTAPESERAIWPDKAAEAAALLADPAAPTPLLDAEVARTGEDKAALATLIAARAAALRGKAAALTGLRRALQVEVAAATSQGALLGLLRRARADAASIVNG